jgi:crotonobetainyl-CoA:carnitine CoA-transferase CaiB-like acyl-CoA transferase
MLRDSLQGVRILDFSHVLSGPVCTMTLADLGADVVKIEPPAGELGRAIGPPWINGESAVFMSVNRNKRSLAIDLKSDAGRKAILEMVKSADVLVENFRPGVMAKLGLDYSTLQRSNNALVYCSISAFGQTGAHSGRPGVDGVIQAESGLMSTLGEAGTNPLKVPVPVADMVGGYLATIAILGALHTARREHRGQYLDISLYNAAIMLQQIGFASFFASGNDPERIGSAAPYACPNEAYPTRDGWLMVVAYHPERWHALCDVIGMPALEADARFATNQDRVHHRAALQQILSELFQKKTTAEWMDVLSRRDILCAPVNRYREVVESAEYRESGIDSTLYHPLAGTVRMPGFGLDGPGAQTRDDRPPPLPGQHSIEVLSSFGISEKTLTELIDGGLIQTSGTASETV